MRILTRLITIFSFLLFMISCSSDPDEPEYTYKCLRYIIVKGPCIEVKYEKGGNYIGSIALTLNETTLEKSWSGLLTDEHLYSSGKIMTKMQNPDKYLPPDMIYVGPIHSQTDFTYSSPIIEITPDTVKLVGYADMEAGTTARCTLKIIGELDHCPNLTVISEKKK